jgi:hypothetical protein
MRSVHVLLSPNVVRVLTPSIRNFRYLTKMCDQVAALISSEHAQTIVWNENDEDDNDTLEVDQEESVTVREGFKVLTY